MNEWIVIGLGTCVFSYVRYLRRLRQHLSKPISVFCVSLAERVPGMYLDVRIEKRSP